MCSSRFTGGQRTENEHELSERQTGQEGSRWPSAIFINLPGISAASATDMTCFSDASERQRDAHRYNSPVAEMDHQSPNMGEIEKVWKATKICPTPHSRS